VIYLSQVSGDYSNGLVVLTSNDNLPLQSNGGAQSFFFGFSAVTNLVPTDYLPDFGISNLVATAGTEGDSIYVDEIASVYDPARTVILRPPDSIFTGRNKGPFIFPGYLHIGDFGTTPTYLRMEDETVACRGGFRLDGSGGGASENTHLEAGTETIDDARIDGPTIISLGVPSDDAPSGGQPWQSSFNFYAGAIIDASQDLVAGAAGSPDPWVGATPNFVSMTGIRFTITKGQDHDFKSMRFSNLTAVVFVTGGGAEPAAAFVIDRVGMHVVGAMNLLGVLATDVRMDDAVSGLVAETPGTVARFDSCIIVTRSSHDAETSSAPAMKHEYLDCLFMEATDNNDPTIKINTTFRTEDTQLIDILHRIDAKVTDTNGAAVVGATIKIFDVSGTQLAAPVTDADGEIATQILVRDSYAPGKDTAWWAANFPSGKVDTMSGHVAAGIAVLTTNTPLRIEVSVTEFNPYVVFTTLDGPLNCVYRALPMGDVHFAKLQENPLRARLASKSLKGKIHSNFMKGRIIDG